ncbi:hypothetical protein SELMODRAFT_426759 [Selaginella moellendorffii]|uniref:MYB transcription factor n=1 Tax=Selaginella moellendorffii TaxID=88036 RepID=D8SXE4_SELML|nr:single myb histone 1 [Selaginella moellendorffii]XP_024517737.1 single myb histone 1 [Selaginella moellendorffii]XP_024517738.1 single myb histone 1 [Selaginella moellendorffii]EFJ10871.1 hypothetical protein SELMODRAFT_426759 [Selaginella moellendorffii]|eukprot:XP_002988079.1 single myb histone 1 [Selaginella moellendorffii]
MGAPKQKWTPEEEAALRAGVEKYGAGKWRAIQKDPKFGPVLKSRSNVDLKDKWRNLSACSGPGGPRSSKVLGLPSGGGMRKSMDAGLSPLQIDPLGAFPDPAAYQEMREMASTPSETSPQSYDDFILEAIIVMKHPGGSSSAAIANFVEEHHMVPPNFRKLLNAKLKALTVQGKLMKVDQNYKINTGSSKPRGGQRPDSDDEKAFGRDAKRAVKSKKPKMDIETATLIVRESEEASLVAATRVAEADALAQEAEMAARELETAEALAFELDIAAEVAAYALRPHRKSRASLGGVYCNPIANQS